MENKRTILSLQNSIPSLIKWVGVDRHLSDYIKRTFKGNYFVDIINSLKVDKKLTSRDANSLSGIINSIGNFVGKHSVFCQYNGIQGISFKQIIDKHSSDIRVDSGLHIGGLHIYHCVFPLNGRELDLIKIILKDKRKVRELYYSSIPNSIAIMES